MPTIPRTYLTTQNSTLSNIQPKNGQVIAIWDTDAMYYDVPNNGAADGTPVRRKISSAKIIYTLDGFISRAGGTGTQVPMEDIIYVYIRPATDPEILPGTNQPLYDMRVWIGDAETGEWYIVGTNRDDANVKSETSNGKFYIVGSPTADAIVGSLYKNSAIYAENGVINGTITNAQTASQATNATLAYKAENDAATPPKPITSYLYDVQSDATTNLGSIITFTLGDGTTKSIRVSDTKYNVYTSGTAGLVPATSSTVTQDASNLLLSGDGWIDKDNFVMPASDMASKDGLGQVIANTYIKNAAYNPTTEDLTVTYGNDTTGTVHIPDTKYSVFTTSVDGLVPKAPSQGNADMFLRGNGTWSGVFTTDSVGLVPAPTNNDTGKYLRGDHTWQDIPTFAGGTAGLVPTAQLSDTNKYLKGDGTWAEGNNTAGSNQDSSKLFLVGAKSQTVGTAGAQTFSNAKVYVQNDKLYSNNAEVVDLNSAQAITNKISYNGYVLSDACAADVADTLDQTTAVTEEFTGNGTTTTFGPFTSTALDIFSVTLNPEATILYSLDTANNTIVFDSAPASNTVIDVSYTTNNPNYDSKALPNSDTVVGFISDSIGTATSQIYDTLTTKTDIDVIAPVYSDNSTYAIGDYCTHTDVNSMGLYRCKIAVSTAEEFQPLKWDKVDVINVLGKSIITTLLAGQTSVTIYDSSITTSSTIDYYTDKFGVSPTNVIVTQGQVSITFEAQSSNLGVKVVIS